MPIFLITGLPGSGKTTVCKELQRRGYTAYDGDEDHLAHWYNNQTGLPVTEEYYKERTPEFLRGNSRDIRRGTIEELATQAQGKPVFICGDPENEVELLDLFQKVFALVLDEDIRQQRLLTRTNNQWGKLSHEREYSIAYGRKWEGIRKKFHYFSLDATQPTKEIVDEILQVAAKL